MGFWKWLGKGSINLMKYIWTETTFKLMIPGLIITVGYVLLLRYLNGSDIMRSPYFELSLLSFPMMLLSIGLPWLYEIYKEENPVKR